MKKKTKEAIKATAAIVIVVVLILGLWIYPLNQAGKMVTPPVSDSTAVNLADFGLVADTVQFVTEDNLKLWGLVFPPDSAHADSIRGTFILLHGLTAGISSQLAKAAVLTHVGYQVVSYDQRGYSPSDGQYYSGGYFEGNDLQSVVSRLALEDKIIRPLIVWGEDQGATAAIRIWDREKRIDDIIAENPIVNGRDWEKRIKKDKDLSVPGFMMGLVWWWMKQKSGYEIPIEETDINDAYGTALVDHATHIMAIACGGDGVPSNPYLTDMMSFGTADWLVLPCSDDSTMFQMHRDTILQAVERLVSR
jgi:pimeloyl-ACP methyl ester carboxylesterase